MPYMETIICPVNVNGTTTKITFNGTWIKNSYPGYWDFLFEKPFILREGDCFLRDWEDLIVDEFSDYLRTLENSLSVYYILQLGLGPTIIESLSRFYPDSNDDETYILGFSLGEVGKEKPKDLSIGDN
jgi:hypothetical protein